MQRTLLFCAAVLLVAACPANPDATLESATGAFESWHAADCICSFSKAGSQGVVHDLVTVTCWGYKPPPFAEMDVDVNIDRSGERLYSFGSGTGSLPNGHPFTVGGVTDAIAGGFEPVGMNRHRIPVKILKIVLPAQHQCDQFAEIDPECVDFPGGTVTNLSTYCEAFGDDWK